jgi:glycosyltransferase involved in cell wall biosynthesis
MSHKITVIIPAFNEEASIARVISDIPIDLVAEVVVVDNNSIDATVKNAQNVGATVIHESRQGYGYACQKGVEYLSVGDRKPDIIVFLDGDYSDYPEEIISLVKPVIEQDFDLVIGSRLMGMKDKRTMPFHQFVGNRLLTLLIRALYGVRFTDLGPFRAIKYDKLEGLDIGDRTYGWPTEMQVKAVKQGLSITEVPVNYRNRIGKSKISGTVKGTVLALYKILVVIFANLFTQKHHHKF